MAKSSEPAKTEIVWRALTTPWKETHVEAMPQHEAELLSEACLIASRAIEDKEKSAVLWGRSVDYRRRAERAAEASDTRYRWRVGKIRPVKADGKRREIWFDGREMICLYEKPEDKQVWVDARDIKTVEESAEDGCSIITLTEGRQIVVNGVPAELANGIEYARAEQDICDLTIADRVQRAKDLEAQMRADSEKRYGPSEEPTKVIDFQSARAELAESGPDILDVE